MAASGTTDGVVKTVWSSALPPALRHRDFRLFWLGLVASAVGSAFTSVALAWQIYQLTNSPAQLGLLGLAAALPQMALLLFGGLLADRRDRRRIMMATQLGQFSVSSLLVATTVTGTVTPLVLYIATGLLALCTALESPSRQALVPNLVPPADLTSAMALNSTQRDVGAIVGPALAGILLAASGPVLCYTFDAVSWLVMLGALLAIQSEKLVPAATTARGLAAVREGLTFVWAHPVILTCMVLDFGATFFGSSRALYPIYARDILAVGATGLGLLYSASAIGSLVAATVMSAMQQVRRAGLWTLIGVAAYGGCIAAFAVSRVFWLSLLLLAGAGAGNMVSSVLRNMINQLSTPNVLRGRVSAVNSIFTMGGPQLGQFESGIVAQVVSTPVSALTGGLGTLVLVAGIAALPWVRGFELLPPEPREEPAPSPS